MTIFYLLDWPPGYFLPLGVKGSAPVLCIKQWLGFRQAFPWAKGLQSAERNFLTFLRSPKCPPNAVPVGQVIPLNSTSGGYLGLQWGVVGESCPVQAEILGGIQAGLYFFNLLTSCAASHWDCACSSWHHFLSS